MGQWLKWPDTYQFFLFAQEQSKMRIKIPVIGCSPCEYNLLRLFVQSLNYYIFLFQILL